MKYIVGIVILVLVVVLIAVMVSKVPGWLGGLKLSDITKGIIPKPPTAKTPTTPVSPAAPTPTINPLSNIPDSAIPYGFTREQLSSYFGKVNISYVSQPSFYSGRFFSEIVIYTSLSSQEKLDVTGWILRSQKGEIKIPQGVEIYDPAYSQTPQNIFLKSGDSISLYSNGSKIGLNFKLNKCTGYLEKIFDFTPDLPLDCPRPSRAELTYLTPACQDYVSSLGTCQIPEGGGLLADSNCRDVLAAFTYRPCLESHRNDSYFSSSRWLIWAGSSNQDANILNPVHDRLLLLDKSGLLVDEYSY